MFLDIEVVDLNKNGGSKCRTIPLKLLLKVQSHNRASIFNCKTNDDT